MSHTTHVLVWNHQPWRGDSGEVAVQHFESEYEMQNLVRDFHANGAGYIFAGSMNEFRQRLKMPLEEES